MWAEPASGEWGYGARIAFYAFNSIYVMVNHNGNETFKEKPPSSIEFPDLDGDEPVRT